MLFIVVRIAARLAIDHDPRVIRVQLSVSVPVAPARKTKLRP